MFTDSESMKCRSINKQLVVKGKRLRSNRVVGHLAAGLKSIYG